MCLQDVTCILEQLHHHYLAFYLMSENKETIERYMQGFRESDHAKVLSCLTDDVIWEMPGIYKHIGKEAFDREIENENFVGSSTIRLHRLVEEGSVVIA